MKFAPLIESLFWIIAALVGTGAAGAELNGSDPTGYYVFRPRDGSVAINLEVPFMRNQNIAGVVFGQDWASIEPSPGVFRWARLDKAAKRTTELKKKFMLELLGGLKSPAWTGGNTAQYTEKYVAAYEKMIAEAGKRFAGYDNLTAVHCSLPSSKSAEFSSPPASLTRPGWQAQALAVNKRALIAIAKAFPGKVVIINLHNPTGAADGFAAAQCDQIRKTLGAAGGVQENSWKATNQYSYNLWQLCKSHAAAGYPMGLEAVTESTDSRFQGRFVDGLKYAREAKARWLIIYEHDDQYCKTPFWPY